MSRRFSHTVRGQSAVFADRRLLARAGLALVLANARYWTSVAPEVRAQLARWRARAIKIEHPELRELARHTLQDEGFAAEVAATLATLTPRRYRTTTIRGIVALEVMYDYLDGVTEQPAPDPLANGRQLFKAMTDALDPSVELADDYYRYHPSGCDDGGFLRELAATIKDALASLPSAEALVPTMQRAATRCREAEVLTHAATLTDTSLAERWARETANGSGLEWREYLAGAASSVLAIHALIALAGDERTTAGHALPIDEVYLALGVLSTMLDSIVDYEQDAANGTLAYINHYNDTSILAERLVAVAQHATTRARDAPASAHHVMTMTGIAAYYTSTPSATTHLASTVTTQIHTELQPLITPTLAIMRTWRLAKRTQTHHRSSRAAAVLCAVFVAVCCHAVAVQGVHATAYAGEPVGRARVAHVLKATDTARLHYVSASGSVLLDEGKATGTLPGSMRVHLDLGATFTGTFTIYAGGGSITGRGSATPHGSGTYESFAGTLTVTGGSGRYVHAHGHGGLYGTFDRDNYALVIKTTGSLIY
jgi:tetraprenyl-beta-curcumene synthase